MYKDITGERFGKLVAIQIVGSDNGKIWECQCDCGKKVNVRLCDLTRKNGTKSCGCLRFGIIRNYKHGYGGTRIYNEYQEMIYRCKPDYRHKENYYERGIDVCKEWKDNDNGLSAFVEWAKNNGYSDELTLDRIDNNKGYSPDNCRWATYKQQSNNRRSCVYITMNGETKTMMEWCEYLGIKKHYHSVKARIQRGWNPEKALVTPFPRRS